MDCCGRLHRVSSALGKATSSDTMWVGILKFLEFTERVVHSRSWARFESAGQGGRVPLGGLDWLDWLDWLDRLDWLDWLGGLAWLGFVGWVCLGWLCQLILRGGFHTKRELTGIPSLYKNNENHA